MTSIINQMWKQKLAITNRTATIPRHQTNEQPDPEKEEKEGLGLELDQAKDKAAGNAEGKEMVLKNAVRIYQSRKSNRRFQVL